VSIPGNFFVNEMRFSKRRNNLISRKNDFGQAKMIKKQVEAAVRPVTGLIRYTT
jgi:hypothetical protein